MKCSARNQKKGNSQKSGVDRLDELLSLPFSPRSWEQLEKTFKQYEISSLTWSQSSSCHIASPVQPSVAYLNIRNCTATWTYNADAVMKCTHIVSLHLLCFSWKSCHLGLEGADGTTGHGNAGLGGRKVKDEIQADTKLTYIDVCRLKRKTEELPT